MSNITTLKLLDSLVYGHESAKKALITSINRSKYRHYQKFGLECETCVPKLNTLLLGQSGTGKTLLIESLAKAMEFPLIRLDALALTPTGNNGGHTTANVKKMILENAKSLLNTKAHYNSVEGIVDQTVVFIDEIDKLGESVDSSGKWNEHVQANFLTLIDNKEEYASVTWVLAGAFTGVTKTESVVKHTIGFSSEVVETQTVEIGGDDIVKAGLLPELVGRINSIQALDQFTEEDFKAVLDERLIPEMEAAMPHLSVSFTEEEKNEMVKKAYKSEQGIRAMQRELNDAYLESEFENEQPMPF